MRFFDVAARRAACLFAIGALAAGALAQTHRAPPPDEKRVPAQLRLKGDPAATAPWAALAAPPAPFRDGDGRVRGAAYLCRSCAAEGLQATGPETPQPAAQALGRTPSAAEAWAARMGAAAASTFALRGATLLCATADGPAELTADEAARLRVWFPKLPASPKTLTAHQRAHVWAERAAAAAADAAATFDPDGAATRPPSATQLVFETEAAARAAAEFLGGKDAWPLAGGRFAGDVYGVAFVGRDGVGARRRFAFALALALARARVAEGSAAAPWMPLGFAHWCERRVPGPPGEDDVAGTLPPDATLGASGRPPADRRAFVRGLVDVGETPRFDALCASTERGLTTRSRLAAESLTSFLLGIDARRYATLYRTLGSAAGEESRAAAFARVLSAVYGADAANFDEAWRLWAVRHG